MSCDHLPLDQLTQLVIRAVAASADGDTEAVAEATRPVFVDGTPLDGYLFLCGVFGSTEKLMGGHDPRPTALRFARVDNDGSMHVTEPEDTPAEVVAHGRLFTAYLNRDTETSAALWEASVRNDTAPAVIALALFHAGQLIRAGAR